MVQHWHAINVTIRLYRLNQNPFKCWYSHEQHHPGHISMGFGDCLYFTYWEKPRLEAGFQRRESQLSLPGISFAPRVSAITGDKRKMKGTSKGKKKQAGGFLLLLLKP